MKQISVVQVLVVAFALLLGVVVGGIGPRSQVYDLEKKLSEAKECATSQMGTELANVFRGRPWEEGRPSSKRVTSFDPEPGDPEPSEPELDVKITFNSDPTDEEITTKEVDASLDVAREALELRYTQARAALLQDASPSEDQLVEIDAAIEGMNRDLVNLARDFSDSVVDGREPGRREMMEFAAETLDVFLGAEDALRVVLTEDQIANMQEESLDPMSYIDPTLIDILSELNR